MRVPRPFDPEEVDQPQGREYKKHVEREEKPLATEDKRQSRYHVVIESTESLPDSPNEGSEEQEEQQNGHKVAINLVKATISNLKAQAKIKASNPQAMKVLQVIQVSRLQVKRKALKVAIVSNPKVLTERKANSQTPTKALQVIQAKLVTSKVAVMVSKERVNWVRRKVIIVFNRLVKHSKANSLANRVIQKSRLITNKRQAILLVKSRTEKPMVIQVI